MFTRGLMTTPAPTRAPKHRRIIRLMADGIGKGDKNTAHLTKYHNASIGRERPRSSPLAASNRSFLTRVRVDPWISTVLFLSDKSYSASFHVKTERKGF